MNPPTQPTDGDTNTPDLPQRRQIRGPQSALTDFLASHNISAQQIRQDANARRAAALASQQGANNGDQDQDEDDEEDETPNIFGDTPAATSRRKRPAQRKETTLQAKKRKQAEEKAIAKIKASKRFQKGRRLRGSDEDNSEEDDAAESIWMETLAPLPAQMANCELCDTRFTVTGYSKAGPDGGLLCQPCTRELQKEEGAANKKRKVAAGRQRRKLQSDLLDGIYPGAKSLVTICVKTLVKHVDMADSLGDLPESLMTRLSWIICKKRMMKPNVLNLFLQRGRRELQITDGAYLKAEDYIRIFQMMPSITDLRLINGIHFKNVVMDHLFGTDIQLEHISLHGVNLIDNEHWDRFIREKTSSLKSFKAAWTDQYFGDDQVELLAKIRPQLTKLKITHNQSVTDRGVEAIANFMGLQQIALELYRPPGLKAPTSAPLVKAIEAHASSLRRFSLNRFYIIDDTILQALRQCHHLTKLRIAENECITDAAFAQLFTDWANPPLTYVDFNKCAHVDSAIPRDNPDGVGLCSEGFKALMDHSGKTLRYLDINHCRHIGRKAFLRVFDLDKTYPELRKMNISFCQEVNDYVVQSIFKTCPALKELIVFGCFKVQDVKVPRGRILIGMPNALGMQIEGAQEEEGQTAW